MTAIRRLLLIVAPALAGIHTAAAADELALRQPQPWQVVQRIGTAAGVGYADVAIQGDIDRPDVAAEWDVRISEIGASPSPQDEWQPLRVLRAATSFSAQVIVPAGGWYRLELRCRPAEGTPLVAAVEPFGVGELFLVAGQSYATNCNDERLSIHDAAQRVAAFDLATGRWQVASDPQPVADGSHDGSIWPPLGDALVSELHVPVGFINVAVGATSSTQWLPDAALHSRLVQAGTALQRFRAVLWQQGESDVIDGTSTEEYVEHLVRIRTHAEDAWGRDVPWLLAKSTHHPTVYDNPEGENRIRAAIDQLTRLPGFKAGPDTDTLRGENRGGDGSRRHFSGLGQRRAADMWHETLRREFFTSDTGPAPLHIGMADVDITPPEGFPMAGYYHERLAEGMLDPLRAKAIVLRDGDASAALVICDLIGIATDLSREVRRRAAERCGIPASGIVIAATHSHTAPDYMKELWLRLGNEPQDARRAAYIDQLVSQLTEVIVRADADRHPVLVESGIAIQRDPVSFNRRFVMRDGSVRTWQSLNNPDVVRPAGPIDPRIGLLSIRTESGRLQSVVSNFALHLDTVGGTKWSADYPFYMERTLQSLQGNNVLSIFGTGCCGDINHVNPASPIRNTADQIGGALGKTISDYLPELKLVQDPRLHVRAQTVALPLQDATEDEVAHAITVLETARRREPVDFFEHVTAHKKIMLDQLRHSTPWATTQDHITWGLSRSLAGTGETLPVDVTVITLGHEAAIVCLPGEVFVELGMAIRQGSPFRNTLVIELSNTVETVYIPNRAAYAGGSYEVTNSATRPGAGEMLVETALTLLREAASAPMEPR